MQSIFITLDSDTLAASTHLYRVLLLLPKLTPTSESGTPGLDFPILTVLSDDLWVK